MCENENTNFVEKRKNISSEIRLSGVPPSTIYQNAKIIERNMFSWAKIKTRTLLKSQSLSKNVQKNLSGIRFTGVPRPSTIYKNSKKKERTLFWWAKSKTRNLSKTHTLSKNVKINPHDTFYRGPSSLYYLQKLQKHRTNSVLMREN